jgi:hypothetical protein
MKNFRLRAPSPALLISVIALFVALGGTTYAAATSLPVNSVGTPQLKNLAVTGPKIANGAVGTAQVSAGLIAPNATRVGGLTAAQLQQRVSGSCGAGSAIRVVGANGTVTCQATPAANACLVTDGATSYSNLQTAINAAASGATLIVFGVCHGNFNFSPASAATLAIEGSPMATLQGDGTATEFTVGANATLTMLNLVVTGGSASGDGGGIYNNGTLILQGDTQVVDNSASSNGGGIYNTTGTLTLEGDTQIIGNSAGNVGGGIVNSNATAVVEGNTQIDQNVASLGAGVYSEETSMTLTDSAQIDDNTAGAGGGVWLFHGSLTLQGSSQIDDNTATAPFTGGNGGGIVNQIDAATLTLEGDSQVNGNTAASDPGIEGAYTSDPNTGDIAQIADNHS